MLSIHATLVAAQSLTEKDIDGEDGTPDERAKHIDSAHKLESPDSSQRLHDAFDSASLPTKQSGQAAGFERDQDGDAYEVWHERELARQSAQSIKPTVSGSAEKHSTGGANAHGTGQKQQQKQQQQQEPLRSEVVSAAAGTEPGVNAHTSSYSLPDEGADPTPAASYSAHLMAAGALVLLILVVVLGILARFALLAGGLQGLGWWAAGYVHGIHKRHDCLNFMYDILGMCC